MVSPNDLILRIPEPSRAEREFIRETVARMGISTEGVFLHWMREAKARAEAGGGEG